MTAARNILAAVGLLAVLFAGWFLYCALSIVLGAGMGVAS